MTCFRAICCLIFLFPGTGSTQNLADAEPWDQSPAVASTEDHLPHNQVSTGSTVILPVLGYTPDTGLMLGGTILHFFYLEPDFTGSRPSAFSPVFIYTLKNQMLLYLGLSLNWDHNRQALNMVPSFLKFPDQFYGLGRNASLDDEEDFTYEKFGFDVDYSHQLWREWRLGISGQVVKHRLSETDPQGQLANGSIPGADNSWFSGLGPSLMLDTRDNTWAPARGYLLWGTARFGGQALGSDYHVQEYLLDFRGYRSLGGSTVLAGQILANRFEGDTPFFMMPRLGGDDGLRGYRGALFRDQTLLLTRLEIRQSNLWGPLGAAVFAGVGDVAPTPGKLTLAQKLWSAGFGFRYLLDERERVNLRLDFGFGQGDSGFYLTLGEAF